MARTLPLDCSAPVYAIRQAVGGIEIHRLADKLDRRKVKTLRGRANAGFASLNGTRNGSNIAVRR